LEDIGIMRVHPGLVTLAPADYEQTRNALLKTWDMTAPIYYRIGKNDRDTVSGLNGDFELGQLQVVREGKDILLLSMGSVGREVVEAANLLQEVNINAGVAVIASINPPPVDDLCLLLSQHELVVTVEAHYVNGGIGSLVSEVIAEKGLNTRIVRKGVQGSSNGFSGSEQSMLRMHKLDKLSIVETVKYELSLMAH
jgi:transketolase